MQVKFGTKIPGVTAKQLFAFQLKSIKSKLKPLWKAFSGRATNPELEWTRTFGELYDVINSLVSLFFDANAVVNGGKRNRDSETEFQKLISVLRSEEDTCLDILKCIGIYYYIEAIEHNAKPLSLSTELDATMSVMVESLFTSTNHSEKAGDKMQVDTDVTENEEEDNGQSGTRAVNNDQYIVEVIGVAAELLKTVTDSVQASRTTLKPLLSFTTHFLEGTLQNVLVLFSNRKKLYSQVCTTLVPPALTLFDCRASDDSVAALLHSLRSTVSESLEMGLLDEKHVDDLATIYLPGTEELTATLPSAGGKHKKQKATIAAAPSTVGDGASGDAVDITVPFKVVKYNPSFLEGLFQRLSEYFYTENCTSDTTAAVEWSRRADSISQLLVIYADKSRAKAVATKQSTEPDSSAGPGGNQDISAVSLDIVNLRKHLQRVMHFAFLLLEFLRRKPSSANSSSTASVVESGKRKAETSAELLSFPDLSGCDLIAYKTVRNRVLKSLCTLLEGQAIPNHDSLAVYQARLQLLAKQSCVTVKRICEKITESVSGAEVDVSDLTQHYQTIALELECYRIVVTIDQTSIMDDLSSSVQLLMNDVSLIPGDVVSSSSQSTKTASKKKATSSKTTSSAVEKDSPSGGDAHVPWQWHLDQHFSLTADSLYQSLVDRSVEKHAATCSSSSSRPHLAVLESIHDPLTIDCLRHYEGSIEEYLSFLPELMSSTKVTSLTEAQVSLYNALISVYHSKYLLFHLYVAVHSQLRTVTDFVRELSKQDSTPGLKLVNDLIVSPKCQSLLLKAFLVIPTGQVPLMWEALSKPNGETAEQSSVVGIVSSSVLRSFVHSIERTVRSTSQLYSRHGVNMEAANEDPLLHSMVTLLARQSDTIQSHSLQSGSSASDQYSGSQTVKAVLDSLSSLVGFATHYFSSAVSQMLMSVTLNAEVSISFHELAVTKAFDNIVQLSSKSESLTVTEQLNALLSLVLLQSNVSAKAVTLKGTVGDSHQQLSRLITPFVSLLSGLRSSTSSGSLKVLLLLLSNIHIWLQFTQIGGDDEAVIQSALLVPLFTRFVRSSLTKMEVSFSSESSLSSHTNCEENLLLSAVETILRTVSVVDSPFVQSTLLQALDLVWSEDIEMEKMTQSARLNKECLWILVSGAILPSSNLDKVIPRFYSHLLKTVSLPATPSVDTVQSASTESVVRHLLQYLRRDVSDQVALRDGEQSHWVNSVRHLLSEVIVEGSASSKGKGKAKKTAEPETPLKTSLQLLHVLKGTSFGDVIKLASVLIDRWISHLIQSSDEEDSQLKELLSEVTEVVADRKVTPSVRLEVIHVVVSRLIAELSTKKDSIHCGAALAFAESLTKKLTSSASSASDCDCYCLADALMLHRSLTSSAEDGLQGPLSVLTTKSKSHSISLDESAEGWLYLSGSLTQQWISSSGAVTVKQLPGDSRTLVRVDLNKITEICESVGRAVEQHINHQAAAGIEGGVSRLASWAVVELLRGLLEVVIHAGVCDCDGVDVFKLIHRTIVVPLIWAAEYGRKGAVRSLSSMYAAAFSKDVLFSLLQLLELPDAAKDKVNLIAEQSLRTTKSTLEKLITVQPAVKNFSDAESLLSLLQHIQDITAYLGAGSAVNNKKKQREEEEAEEDSEQSAAVIRQQLWSTSLLSVMATLSHKLSFTPITSAESVPSALIRSLGVVDVSKQILSCMEGIVTHSSLTHLSSSLASFIQLLCRLINILIKIENSLAEEGNSTSVSNSIKQCGRGVGIIQERLVQCYNLVAKTLSNIASSRDLQKDTTLVAAVVVDQLTKLRLSKAVKDNLFPGLYALFEKCDLKLKQQMFRRLDVQARALMTDIHDEYMRSFKFIGK